MNQYALLTGASRGIGEAVAGMLAKEGYNLYLICRNSADELRSLCKELSETYHVSCTPFIGDVGDYAFISSCFEKIDRLDVLINNAGISYVGLLQDMKIGEWNSIVSTNLTSCFNTCQNAIPAMVTAKSGRIINISSIWGNVGGSMEVAYSATKGGINAFSKALAKELAPSNIQVNAVAFGAIDTDMNKCFRKEELDALAENIPAGRLGTADEAAAMIMQIIHSPSYLTGQIITMDGGFI